MLALACCDELLHHADHILDRHSGILRLLVEEINGVDVQPSKARVDNSPYALWPRVGNALGPQAELGSYGHFAPERSECVQEVPPLPPAVHLCGVDVRHTEFVFAPEHRLVGSSA